MDIWGYLGAGYTLAALAIWGWMMYSLCRDEEWIRDPHVSMESVTILLPILPIVVVIGMCLTLYRTIEEFLK